MTIASQRTRVVLPRARPGGMLALERARLAARAALHASYVASIAILIRHGFRHHGVAQLERAHHVACWFYPAERSWNMWGIIPAAGRGSRIQPLAFSKELLPVGSRRHGQGERPVAVSEHLLERMLEAGVDRLCFIIAPGKSDILEYYGGKFGSAEICYVVQQHPAGLCDALFRALPFMARDELACVGLPDTIWFPREGFAALDGTGLSFLCFPVAEPQRFDAVVFDAKGVVEHIDVKAPAPRSHWVWGAFKVSGRVLGELHALWQEPARGDEYLGTLVNAYIARGGTARALPIGETYVDVGTLSGYREALKLLEATDGFDGAAGPRLLQRQAYASAAQGQAE